MQYTIVLSPRVMRQIRRASEWWNVARPEVGSLEPHFERAFGQLMAFPELGIDIGHRRRRFVIAETPYSLVYRVRPRLRVIEVASISDARRR